MSVSAPPPPSSSDRPAPSATGRFARTPFAHVLQYARERRLTGTLAVQAEDGGDLAGETLVVLERGSLAQARLPRVLDPLGLLLREQGAIDDAQLNASLRELADRAGAALHGEILRAMGACSDAVIERALREQLRRKVLRLFTAGDAAYAYYDAVDLLEGWGRERYPESVLPVIWRGVCSWTDERSVAAVLTQVAGRALRLRRDAAEQLAQFEFDRATTALLEVLQAEPLSPEALEHLAPDGRRARLLAYTLVITRQVELSPSGQARAVTSRSGSMPAAGAATAGPRRMASFGQMPAVTPPRPPSGTMPAARRVSSQPPAGEPAARVKISSRPPPARSVPPAAREALEQAESRLRAMQDETYFEMLGVTTSATTERVAAAFVELAARWHPDRAASDEPAVHAAFDAVFGLLNEAHQVLCDEDRRARYETTLAGGGGTPNARRRVAAALEAADDVRHAEACLRRRAFEDAEQWARKALHANPRDVAALVALAQALLEGTGGAEAVAEAEKLLRAAIALAPEHDRALYQLGVAHKRKGDAAGALRCFKRAVSACPTNVDAMRELRVAQMRRAHGHDVLTPPDEDRGASGGGLFSRLLKK